MQFVPLWTDILDKPNWKILDLPAELYRFWTFCLIAAQKHDYVDGWLPDERTLARWTGMQRLECETLIAGLISAGLIDREGDRCRVHDWDDWRTVKDPKDTRRKRERRAAMRAKKEAERDEKPDLSRPCPALVPSLSRPCPVDVLPQLTTNNIQNTPPTPQTGGDGDDAVVSFGRQAMGDRFDLEAIGSKLPGWRAAKYPDPWIRDALLVANCSAKAGGVASYVTGCLRRWATRGSPDPEDLKRAKPPPETPLKFTQAPKGQHWKGPAA